MRFFVGLLALLAGVNTAQAQQGMMMIQVMDGYSSSAVPRHKVTVATGSTRDEVLARRYVVPLVTDQRGIVLLQMPLTHAAWIQVTVDSMPSCELKAQNGIYSTAAILHKGLQTANTCGKWSVDPAPAHFAVYVREYNAAERAAMKH